jgi:hypothetical protein
MNELRAGEEDARAKGKLYLAFELGNKAWKLGFTVGLGQKPRRREVKAGDLAGLQKDQAQGRATSQAGQDRSAGPGRAAVDVDPFGGSCPLCTRVSA